MTRRPALLSACLAGAAFVAGGCVMAPPMTAGSAIDAAVAERVRTTARTRAELLGQLGVPAAIFSRDRAEPVPGIPSWSRSIPSGHFATSQSGAPAFEVFAGRTPAQPDDLAYYWFHSRSTKTALVGPGVVSESAGTKISRLRNR